MNRHRPRNFNPINAPSLARWIVIIAFLATTGLSYVYLSVQLHHQGVQRRLLEQELIATRMQNEDAKVQFAALTSRSALPPAGLYFIFTHSWCRGDFASRCLAHS